MTISTSRTQTLWIKYRFARIIRGIALLIAVAGAACDGGEAESGAVREVTRAGTPAVMSSELEGSEESTAGMAAVGPVMKVYKTASCGCCSKWVDHMRDSGFTVEAEDVTPRELVAIKLGAGLDSRLHSCHTAFVDGYAIEGHVPAEVVTRFLAETPVWKGLAVAGMPIGSPGMEAGDRRDPYDVIAFGDDGKMEVYESIR